jgi:hypothetical protein
MSYKEVARAMRWLTGKEHQVVETSCRAKAPRLVYRKSAKW